MCCCAALTRPQTATLRKVNKLWPTDPVHVRTSLYVPLESCRPTSAHIVRNGTSVSLVPHVKPSPRVKSPRQANGDAMSILSDRTARGSLSPDPEPPEAQEVLLGEGEDPLTSTACPTAHEIPGAIPLQVIKLPASRLHLYPSSRRKGRASAGRVSMDSDASGLSGLSGGLTTLSLNDAAEEGGLGKSPSRKADEGRFFNLLPSSMSDSGLASNSRHDGGRFAPLMPRVDGFGPDDEPDTFGSRRSKRVVKLRPPAAHTPHKSGGVVGRISDFFNPPPPPLDPGPRRQRASAARIVSEPVSRQSSASGSPAATPSLKNSGDLEVELRDAHKRRPKPNKKTD